MPISPSKWRSREARKSVEQRDRAKKRGRFRPRRVPDPPATLFGDVANNLTNPVEYPALFPATQIGDWRYYPVETQVEHDFAHFGEKVTIRFQAQQHAYTSVLAPTFYTGNTLNPMAYSTNAQMTWQTWQNPQYYNTGSFNNYQTYAPQQMEVTWQGWVNQTYLNQMQTRTDYLETLTAQAAREINAQFNPQRTPEQIEAERVAADQRRHQAAIRRAEQERIHAEARLAQDEALRRATATFIEVLTPEERETYERERCIYVKSQHGRRYRIRCERGQSGNVELLDHTGTRTAAFCVHPSYQDNGHLLPDPDAWLTQKLYIEHFEDTLLEKANVTFGQRPGREGLILPGGNVGNPVRHAVAA